MASEIEVLQPGEGTWQPMPKAARRGEPALEAALPVPGKAREGSRRGQVRVLKLGGDARKALVEDADDLPDQALLGLGVIRRAGVPEPGPVLEAREHPHEHDRLAIRAKSRVWTKDAHFKPVMAGGI